MKSNQNGLQIDFFMKISNFNIFQFLDLSENFIGEGKIKLFIQYILVFLFYKIMQHGTVKFIFY